jgi:ATPase family associated with various cellular activities (AAA)
MADLEGTAGADFSAAFLSSLQEAAAAHAAEPPAAVKALIAHFGGDLTQLQTVAEGFPSHDHANVQQAVDAYLGAGGRSAELMGLSADAQWVEVTFAQLVAGKGQRSPMGGAVSDGPVHYVNVALGEGEVVTCVQRGLYLIRDGDVPLALLMRGRHDFCQRPEVSLEVLARDRTAADALLAAIRSGMRDRNVFRSRVLQISRSDQGEVQVRFHRLPTIARDQIILPTGLLERVERQTIRFAALSDRLRAAGRHLKHGVLLYGPPGTGKTLTAMYLSAQMRERTVILMAGQIFQMGVLRPAFTLARSLQPATLVLEDVDLIAEDRTQSRAHPQLYELLDQMDGLHEDADVMFLLTTNRPDMLEPALASRPGRIDLALEVPLPDAECRRRLFALYGRGLTLHVDSWDELVQQTEGASAAFIRELMRRATLLALDEHTETTAGTVATAISDPSPNEVTRAMPETTVAERQIAAALRELIFDGGALTRSLLGARLKVDIPGELRTPEPQSRHPSA